jgi:hypothetical protein
MSIPDEAALSMQSVGRRQIARAGCDVPVQPNLLAGIRIAAAGEGGTDLSPRRLVRYHLAAAGAVSRRDNIALSGPPLFTGY